MIAERDGRRDRYALQTVFIPQEWHQLEDGIRDCLDCDKFDEAEKKNIDMVFELRIILQPHTNFLSEKFKP